MEDLEVMIVCTSSTVRWKARVTFLFELTGLLTIDDYLSRRRLSVFGHIARLDVVVAANRALRLAIDMKEGRRPGPSWGRRPGRPRRTWVDQVRDDAGILYQRCCPLPCRGHGAARRSSARRQ